MVVPFSMLPSNSIEKNSIVDLYQLDLYILFWSLHSINSIALLLSNYKNIDKIMNQKSIDSKEANFI